MAARFAPQLLYPRFSVVADLVSRVPRGLPILMATAGSLIAAKPSFDEALSERRLTSGRLAIVAYPRTGSVVVQTLTDHLLAEPGSTVRTHDPLLIRTLVAGEVPVLIPIRNPQDTILSWSVYNNDQIKEKSLRARCHSYIAWARKVRRLSHRYPLYSVELGVFLRNPENILATIVGRPMAINPALAGSLDTALDDLASNDASPMNQQPTPSTSRERMKDAYRPLLESARVTRLMDRASALNADILAASAYGPGSTSGRD
jgi:hypothetical protein